MTSVERRAQLLEVARSLFAERGFDGTSIEEIAARAGVSKPVVYEHFGGKEGVYAVVVDREVTHLLTVMQAALTGGPRRILEGATMALLDYIEASPDGFRIITRDSPIGSSTFQTIIGDVIGQVEGILVDEFARLGLDAAMAPMHARMLVGMVASTGQWWLDHRSPDKREVAAHLVNLAWNGLSALEAEPRPLRLA
ncbi:TetR/AcrR family transcriptional regulator [Myroides odoratimimus subsp. xuanwuensis]